jgi:hypothetical protein
MSSPALCTKRYCKDLCVRLSQPAWASSCYTKKCNRNDPEVFLPACGRTCEISKRLEYGVHGECLSCLVSKSGMPKRHVLQTSKLRMYVSPRPLKVYKAPFFTTVLHRSLHLLSCERVKRSSHVDGFPRAGPKTGISVEQVSVEEKTCE